MRPLLERYAQPLYGTVILPRLGDSASAEEVLRDTLATAVEKIGRFTWQGKSIYPWLRQIAINKVYDVHRQSKRSRKLADAMVHEGAGAHAKTFAELVDKTLAGKAPPAMSADDRALLEVATVIRAAAGNVELDATKRHSLVEAALRQAVGGKSAPTSTHSVIPIQRSRARRWAPWAVAGTSMVVAAAALLLW